MDLQGGLWMLVTAELARAHPDHEKVGKPSPYRRLVRAVVAAYGRLRERPSAEKIALDSTQVDG
jgi:hypothetical protein